MSLTIEIGDGINVIGTVTWGGDAYLYTGDSVVLKRVIATHERTERLTGEALLLRLSEKLTRRTWARIVRS